MTLQQMRYFIAVAQNLSFSKAAQQHYVSQTAVSQQIKLLEEELETELFQRTRHQAGFCAAEPEGAGKYPHCTGRMI